MLINCRTARKSAPGFDVTKGDLIAAINKGCHTVAALKAETKAGTGCGGCIPLVTQVLNAELAKQGIEVNNNLRRTLCLFASGTVPFDPR
ncbi:(2Fe-2S)-binding protein [Escherichia coli]